MEAATARQARSPSAQPPSVRLPKALQTARFIGRPIPYLEHWRRELGDTFHASLFGPGEVVFISDPESMKRLFSADRVNTIAPSRNIVLSPLLGKGSLLRQEGDEHLRRRRLMLPPFHGERMRAYEAVIEQATERAVAGWPVGEPFALHPSMQAITLEVIVRAVFGVEDESRRDQLSEALVAVLDLTASPAMAGLIAPGIRRLPIYRRFDRLRSRADELLFAEIDERRRRTDLGDREDILSMLVAARFEDGSAMEDSELRDQLLTLLLAGHETTATALAWTFDLLLHRPDALARLREELDRGDHAYLEAVIDESLRVRPVIPFTGRQLLEDAELDGYALPAGTVVLAAIWLTNTIAEVYPDPYAFRPERFLENPPDTYAWIPFGGGTRRCIGAAFAQLEMRVAIETILRSVVLEAADLKPERPVRRNVTLSPARGTRVIARPL